MTPIEKTIRQFQALRLNYLPGGSPNIRNYEKCPTYTTCLNGNDLLIGLTSQFFIQHYEVIDECLIKFKKFNKTYPASEADVTSLLANYWRKIDEVILFPLYNRIAAEKSFVIDSIDELIDKALKLKKRFPKDRLFYILEQNIEYYLNYLMEHSHPGLLWALGDKLESIYRPIFPVRLKNLIFSAAELSISANILHGPISFDKEEISSSLSFANLSIRINHQP